jgi:tetratricopeptide (TPR) repeat protein
MSMNRWCLGAVILILVSHVWAGPGHARAPALDKAREHFAAGQAAYEAGRYQQAIAEFLAGYRIAPRPGFLLNIAQSYRKARQPKEALLYYRTFLKVSPSSPMRPQVAALINELTMEILNARDDEPGMPEAPSPDPTPAAVEAQLTRTTPPARRPDPAPASRPLYKRWWFWASVATVVAAGVGTGIYLGTRDSQQQDASNGVVRW